MSEEQDLLFWIAQTASNWDNTSNWSATSGGPPGFEFPNEDDTAVFDSSGTGTCIINIPVQVNGLNFTGSNSFLGDCTVIDLNLISGSFTRDSDCTFHILGDVFGSANFGTWNPSGVTISFDGTGIQNLFNAPNCIFPSIVVNDFLS
jgi:hypothetical protein